METTLPRSLFSVTAFGRRVAILPLKSLRYLALSLGVLAASLLALDRALIPYFEGQGKLASLGWAEENARIVAQNFRKNLATKVAPVWRSAGFPDAPERRKARRVLVIGDSFVWGSGNANVNDLWWRQLERELGARGYRDVEVVGAGYSGFSTHAELDVAPAVIAAYHPDAVVWGYVTNDPDEGVVKQVELAGRVLNFAGRSAARVLPNLLGLLQDRQAQKEQARPRGKQDGFGYEEWELRLLEGENFALYEQTARRFGEYVQGLGVPSFLMTLPNYPSSRHFTPRYEKVLPLLRAAGVPTHDILPAFVARYGEAGDAGDQVLAWGMNPADGHPGPRSTRFFAERAADLLLERCPACLGPRTPAPAPLAPQINDWTPPEADLAGAGTAAVSFTYPASDLLRMPLKRPFFQLNLETATPLAEIRVAGANLAEATLDVTTEDPAGHFDDRVLRPLGTHPGPTSTFAVETDGRAINTLRLSATFTGPDHHLSVTLVPPAAPPPPR